MINDPHRVMFVSVVNKNDAEYYNLTPDAPYFVHEMWPTQYGFNYFVRVMNNLGNLIILHLSICEGVEVEGL